MSEETISVLVFVPNNLQHGEIGFLEGFSKKFKDCLVFFVTNEKLIRDSRNSIGYCSKKTPENGFGKCLKNEEFLHINTDSGKCSISNFELSDNDSRCSLTCVRYDYKTFLQCETLEVFPENYGKYFLTLIEAIQKKNNHCLSLKKKTWHNNVFDIVLNFLCFGMFFTSKIPKFLKPLNTYSAVIQQFESNVTVWKWILLTLKSKKKITLQVGNALVSKFTDLIFGLLLLFYFFKYEHQILTFIAVSTENLIELIKELLVVLMGSPVGLKLNYKLSQNLGSFFLYHISLWEAFLNTSKPLLRYAIRFLIIPGALGLSYQAALVSDLIAFASFHVYCIYIYAARLYGFQIKGIISLWRLFIGRKYNPLRERVDSHQYTHNQLFIGTLGFTLLLFLLPTTLLYYTVFTVLRLALKVANGILVRLRYSLQCLPIYIIALWLLRSPKIAGSVYLKIEPLAIHATLKSAPLWSSIVRSSEDELAGYPSVSWGPTVRGIFAGTLL